MGGLILILPVVAFDVWLCCTTGRRQFQQWTGRGQRLPILYLLGAGLVLAVVLTFVVQYQWDKNERVVGFPIPRVFFSLEDKTWTRTTPGGLLACAGGAADFLTGLVAPLIPYKIAEFMKTVKAELK